MKKKNKKIEKGDLITSLDELVKCEWIIVREKPYHRGWFMSWQFNMTNNYLKQNQIYAGIKIVA